MKSLILLLAAIAVPVLAKAQLDFQRSLSYSFDAVMANPALLQDHRTTIRIGSVMQSASANFTLNDIGTNNNGNFVLQGSRLAVNAPETMEVSARFDVATLGFNVREDRYQFGAHHAIRFESAGNINRQLASLISQGNQALVGETIQVLPKGEQISYHEVGLHYGIHINHKFAIGGRVKVLAGSAAAQFNSTSGSLRTDPNGYAIDYDLNVDAQTAGYNIDLDAEDFTVSVQPLKIDKGIGGAVDLGIVYRPSRKIEVSLSANDIGGIRWSTDAKKHVANGQGSYAGVIGNVFEPGYLFSAENSLDDLREEAGLSSTDEAFITQLSPKLQGHIRYKLGDATDLTLSAQGENRDSFKGGGALGIAQDFGDFLHVGGIIGLNQGEVIYGLRGSVMLLGAKVFVAADHLPGVINLYDSKAVHFRLGVSLNLKRLEVEGKRYGWFDDEPVTGRTTPDNYL
ncbi:MAG: DUF5723 family protein [Saprospiraceae bacterium]